jgi:hypothetical protein
MAAPLAELGLFGMLVSAGGIAPESALLLLGPLWAMSLGHSWFVFGSHYEVSSTALRLVNGPWRREVALTDVLRARAIRTLDRGPVVQLDIAYGRKLLLTPVAREALLDALETHPPNPRSFSIDDRTQTFPIPRS